MVGMAIAPADEKHPEKFPAFSLLVCVVAILAALALSYGPLREKLDRFEYWTADWRTLLLADRTAGQHERIVLVVFDPATFDGNTISPIPRDTHAQMLRAIDANPPIAQLHAGRGREQFTHGRSPRPGRRGRSRRRRRG